MKQRNEVVDIAKGIGIILVVVGHIASSSFDAIISIIYLFHMPLFFFLSGFYCKTNKSFIQFFSDKGCRLLIPYIIYLFAQTIVMDIIIFASYKNIEEIKGIFLSFHPLAIWFLISLFTCNILHWINSRLKFPPPLLAIVTGVLGCGMVCSKLDLPCCLSQSLLAYPFFYIGDVAYNKIWGNNKRTIYGWLVNSRWNYIVLGIFSMALVFHPNIYTDMWSLTITSFVGCFVYALIGISVVIIASSIISQYKTISRYLSKIGVLSLHVMCLHCMIIKGAWLGVSIVAKRYYPWYDLNNPKGDVFLAVFVLVITLVSSIYVALWIDKRFGTLFNYKIEFKK